MVNTSGMAQVCNINPPAPPPNSTAPFMPAFTQPNPASPQSIITSIVQLQQALIAITGNNVPNNVAIDLPVADVVAGAPPPGSLGGGGGSGSTSNWNNSGGNGGGRRGRGKKTTKNPKQQGVHFQEVHRTYKTVRIYNPKDKTQYVDVKQIVALQFRDKHTGGTWVWKQ
jgi:hypothetical protein